MSELKRLLPGRTITLSNKEKITVSPVAFGKIPEFNDAIASLIGKALDSGMKLEDIADYKNLFNVAFEEVVNIMGIILGKPRPWFDTIDLGDGLEIIDIIVDQNFTERAKKNIQKLFSKWRSLLQTRSSSLSVPAIPGQN